MCASCGAKNGAYRIEGRGVQNALACVVGLEPTTSNFVRMVLYPLSYT